MNNGSAMFLLCSAVYVLLCSSSLLAVSGGSIGNVDRLLPADIKDDAELTKLHDELLAQLYQAEAKDGDHVMTQARPQLKPKSSALSYIGSPSKRDNANARIATLSDSIMALQVLRNIQAANQQLQQINANEGLMAQAGR